MTKSTEVKPGQFSSKTAGTTGMKTVVLMAVMATLSLVGFGILGSSQEVAFRWSRSTDAFLLKDWIVVSQGLGIGAGVLGLAIAGLAWWFLRNQRKIPLAWSFGFGLIWLVAFLGWVGAGGIVPITFLMAGSLVFAVPIMLGGMSGILSERVGVVNIAIEGQLLMGAFVSAVVASLTGNYLLAVILAMVMSALLSMVLAVFSIKYLVDQIIVGVVLNVLVISVTDFLFSQWLNDNPSEVNQPGTLSFLPIPGLSSIPILGPVLFNHRLTVYLVFLLVPLIWFLIFRTKAGLRLRSVGEYPMAADTVGINVAMTRFFYVTLGGAIAGLGGAAISIGNVGPFVKEMSAGFGFIALATVILGRWQPFTVAAAALLFGFASVFRIWAGDTGTGIPSDFITMIPYLVTIIAVAGFVGRVRPPAASGKAYVKE
jgi:general nucleoside transport system permease protein